MLNEMCVELREMANIMLTTYNTPIKLLQSIKVNLAEFREMTNIRFKI